jgi:SagB-type dehydrogenase family enzyme
MKRMAVGLAAICWLALAPAPSGFGADLIKMPAPSKNGKVSLEEALQARRSVRRYAARSLDLTQVSQLLWAADGVNNPQGKRTAPSGKAAYPVDLFLVVGERGVTNLAPGVYKYLVADQALEPILKGEVRAAVARACNSQAWIAEAPVVAVVAGDYQRSAAKNGDKAPLYTQLEAGFVAQNFLLQANALGLGAGVAGGFQEKALAQVLKLPQADIPFLVLPVGYKH